MWIPDEAVEAATGVEIGDLNETVEAPWHLQPEEARRVLEAATPHLRAAWEQPIRELCEGSLAKASDPLASRMFNGSPFPAKVCAKDVLALLEGGAE